MSLRKNVNHVMNVVGRKRSDSAMGIEPMTFHTLSYETRGKLGHFLGTYLTGVCILLGSPIKTFSL